MAVLQARTTLAPGASATVATAGSANFAVNVDSGQATVEIFQDDAAPSGYEVKVDSRPIVIVVAAKIIVTARGVDDCVFEVNAV